LIGREIFCNVVGKIRREPVLSLPVQIMRGVGRVGDVDRVDAAALLLRDPLEIRSAPERSTRTATPGYLASKALASRSATLSSSAE